MTKVPLDVRLDALHQINEIYDNYCEDCPFNINHRTDQKSSYCRQQCEYGKRLLELGEQYCGFKFTQPHRKKIPIDRKICIQMYEDGFSQREIAEHFDVAQGTIRRRLLEWGITGKDRDGRTNDKIVKLHKDGLTYGEIGKKLGISRQLVYARLKKLMKSEEFIDG